MKFFPAVFLTIILVSCDSNDDIFFRPEPLPLTELDTTFVSVPGGIFLTAENDTISINGFRLGRYEVTNRLFYNLADDAGIGLPPDPVFPGMEKYLFDYPDYPVVNVSMDDAASAAAEIGGRLPTLVEWEYAASLGISGDMSEQYPWGPLDPADAEYPANYLAGDEWETRGLDGYLWTAPVDSFPLTDAGFACQAGNVAEWTTSADSLVPICGGAWLSPSGRITINSVKYLSPGDRACHIGFRILLPGT